MHRTYRALLVVLLILSFSGCVIPHTAAKAAGGITRGAIKAVTAPL